MSGPHPVLDGGGSGDEAPRFPTLLQRCFILPHLAMCLKIRERPGENSVLPLADFVPVREPPARRPLDRLSPDVEIPMALRVTYARRRTPRARAPAGAFSG